MAHFLCCDGPIAQPPFGVEFWDATNQICRLRSSVEEILGHEFLVAD
jgi:hypothetical protein